MPSQRLATAPLAGTCRPFWQQKVPLASEIGLVMQNQVLPEWTSHRTYHTIPCFPAGNFSSKRITPPLAFASYPLIVCQVSTSNAPWLDFRVLVQPGLWGGGCGARLGFNRGPQGPHVIWIILPAPQDIKPHFTSRSFFPGHFSSLAFKAEHPKHPSRLPFSWE